MGFVRVWWPPVVVGLVVAVVGIGAAEVAVMPAGGTPMAMSAPARPQPRPASVAPAGIEREDDVAEPEPRLTPTANPSRAAPPRAEPTVAVTPGPKPTAMRSRKPVPKPVPKPKPVLPPVLTPGPSPTLSPPAPPTAPPVRRVAPIVSPTPTPTPTPTPAPVRPAQVLDLRRWKLTLPTGREGHPTEVRQPVLGSLASGTFARLTPDRGVAFRAPVGGVTTENSSYPRSELREMSADGRRKAAWSSASGRHVMTITQAITATPRAKPHVVAGQIHDAEDDVIMIRLEGRRLFVESDGDDVGLLDPAYRLGRRFTVSIVASPAGVRITYKPPLRESSVAAGGAPKSRAVTLRRVGRGWYFKAGCYVQSNPDRGDPRTAFGEVVIYALTVSHT